jgi:hypothetical protein
VTVVGFKRQAVLDATKEAVANLQARLDDWDREAQEQQDRHREAWIRDTLPRLRVVRDKLTAALKKGGVITSEDVGDVNRLTFTPLSDWQLRSKLEHIDRNAKRAMIERIIAYQGVIKLLEAQEGEADDVLSLSALKNLGINKLGELFRAAADKGGSVEQAPI